MKRTSAAAAMTAAMAMAGCQAAENDGAPAAEVAGADVSAAAVAAADREAPAAGPAVAAEPPPAAPGAPGFAVVYPGATPKAVPTLAEGPAGPGGLLEFTTDASPGQVVDFYRRRAEAAGLRSINALSRDDARAYAAGDGADGTGKLLNVVATPLEDGRTDVQLSWSSGR